MMAKASFKTPKLLTSVEAGEGANRLIFSLRTGQSLDQAVSSVDPSIIGKMEEDSYTAYCRFIVSTNGKKLVKKMEVQDGRNICKLY